MSGPLWITEREVVDLMSLPQAIDALRDGLREEAAGQAWNMVKTHAVWSGGSTMHAIGAVFEARGVVGSKVWSHAPGGAMPLLILMDAVDGSVRAVLEAFALGQMRTGGISGVATDLLARPGANRMAMIGAGKQSLAQVAAVAAVRSLEHVAIWSPTATKREALADKIVQELGVTATSCETLEDAIGSADIITLATRAHEPFLRADMVRPGIHINAVGAITPERAEFESVLLQRTASISADSVPQVRKLSREFMDSFGNDEAKWARLKPLCSLVVENATRPLEADLTLFKAMGMGISDLSLGIALYEKAQKAGIGRELPRPVRVPPRLTR